MTKTTRKGLLVAIVHVAMVSGLGVKFLVDRATRPRVWVRAAPVDPNLPIRGRYVSLGIQIAAEPGMQAGAPAILSVKDGGIYATPGPESSSVHLGQGWPGLRLPGADQNVIGPVAYFIPEHVADPSRRGPGEELWVEVTVPRRGLPRPIQLGVKKDGVLTPLDLRN